MFEYEIKESDGSWTIFIVDRYAESVDYLQRNLPSGIDIGAVEQYLKALISHIDYVREAGEMLGVAQAQLLIHDRSKWTYDEFLYYALNFYGSESVKNSPEVINRYARAWLHHMNHNPHHWQYWIFPDGFTPNGSDIENGIVQMPTHFALEMIADWMGASKAYTGSWDMTKWLSENMSRLRLHSKTAEYIRQILDGQGYADIVWTHKFAHEIK